MAVQRLKGYISNVTDETEEVRKKSGMPLEAVKDVKYIRLDFGFKENNIEKTGFVQLLFAEDSYPKHKHLIPEKGTAVTVLKKWFLKTYYRLELKELRAFVNYTKIISSQQNSA